MHKGLEEGKLCVKLLHEGEILAKLLYRKENMQRKGWVKRGVPKRPENMGESCEGGGWEKCKKA